MSESLSTDEQQAANANAVSSESRAHRLPGWRWVVVGLVVLIALGLALGYYQWWTKPDTFTAVGNGLGFKQTTETLHEVTVDMVQRSVHDGAETVTVNRVGPRVVTNTADARISFAVCEGPRFMTADGPPSSACETVTAVEGQQVRLTGGGPVTITMTVTPRQAGRVVIEGMEVDYTRSASHLWQHGSQATGPNVNIRVGE